MDTEDTIEIALNGDYGGFGISKSAFEFLPQAASEELFRKNQDSLDFRTNKDVLGAIRHTWKSKDRKFPYEKDIYIRKIPKEMKNHIRIAEYDGREWITYRWVKWIRDNIDKIKEDQRKRVMRLLKFVEEEQQHTRIFSLQEEEQNENTNNIQNTTDQDEKEPTIEIALNGKYGVFCLSAAMTHRLPKEIQEEKRKLGHPHLLEYRMHPGLIEAVRQTWKYGDKDENGHPLPIDEKKRKLGWDCDLAIERIPETLKNFVQVQEYESGQEVVEYKWDRWLMENIQLFKEEEQQKVVRMLMCVQEEEKKRERCS